MKQAWTDTRELLDQLKANWRPFLAIHVAVTVRVVVVLLRLARVVRRMAVAVAGAAARSDEASLYCIVSPGGCSAGVGLGSG